MSPVPKEVAQKIFDCLLTQQFQEVIPHLTMEIVQKLMTMMQSPTVEMDEIVEEFGLKKTKISINGMTVTYDTPPAKLITHWVYQDDIFKLNDFDHKINKLWMLLNFFKVRRFKAKVEAAKAQ